MINKSLYFQQFREVMCIESLILLGEITLERVKGIEPSSQAWEARILPLNHTRCRWHIHYYIRG